MDKQLRQEIREDVRKSMEQTYMIMTERWVSGKELCEQFAMITPKFLKQHGDIFPRKRITIKGMNGGRVSTHYGYAQHEIAMNIAKGLYDELLVMKDV